MLRHIHWMGLIVLSIAFTWPLADVSEPVLARHDDPLFSVWRLAWIAHQLPNAPAELFDTNIFYPERGTLAYSDAMLLLGLIGAPFIWLGLHPIIVHNLLTIAGFVTAGLAMMRLMARFTSNRTAHVVAALVFTFAPYRASHIAHLELLWTCFLPLALLALYRMFEHPSVKNGVAFGAAVGLQALSAIYYAVFLTIWLMPALALAPLHLGNRWSWSHAKALTIAIGTAVVLASPYLLPYSRAREALGPRPAHDLQAYSAQAADYLRPSAVNRMYPWLPASTDDERGLFVGVVAATLAVVGIVLVRGKTVVVFVILTLVAADLSLGVNGLLFDSLRQAIPFLDGFRAPARFGVLTLLGVAVLCGLAAGRLLDAASPMRRRAAAIALSVALITEYWIAPLPTYSAPLSPGLVGSWLASQPRTVIAHLPFPDPQRLWGYETVFQYLSIFHWQPMVNGYSGFAPSSYLRLAQALQGFPSEAGMAALRSSGAQLVIIRERYTAPGEFDDLLYACHNREWFSEVHMLNETGRGRAAACRIAAVAE
jgi:hypothetical protein